MPTYMTVYIAKRRLLVKLANRERSDCRLEEEDFFITLRLTLRGTQLPSMNSILVLLQLLINVTFVKKKK